MSDSEFHVHGPHDHELEHAAHSNDSFAGKIAVMTAIMATVGALFGFEGGATQNDAAMFKNEAAIKKTEASNQWNFYQAKSSKQNLSELAMVLPGIDVEKYKAKVARYEVEKEEIKKNAEKLEAESSEWDKKSEEALHQHHRWAQAMTAVQIAISLAAITLLTKKKWLQYGSYGVAGVGVILAGLAWLHI
ncbi:DUF4337 domain-containing protein [Undibacterium sp. RTI2.1]|uniref:DUF4337 domain-containing protein n=1 Tax=unclassified Undibacterium TaxID=2630295 RepID=UPI002AB3D8C6|nr:MULTISPECIES: DUF4337 domain-containing protein [unclassified Undibacterium]MDY7538366.1 DUF4337 domain-containing protein [Undibacterium sp. 5I1]MEB0032523.1 DUF4337 domain-containing protein [Undibacterium sp. RTI2.1]MEB0115010.1 DUF4337 domain-containing protein [Undibacterium sp. RTI2.2]MEB0229359.1 DUF4337 domain-containing protein [Undibacterium sp. 10I3]MEB0255969.1 DUF4337 domain-containing protein [Undibacterium sp. 5I1]